MAYSPKRKVKKKQPKMSERNQNKYLQSKYLRIIITIFSGVSGSSIRK